jgi:hypothetical protein
VDAEGRGNGWGEMISGGGAAPQPPLLSLCKEKEAKRTVLNRFLFATFSFCKKKK